MLADESLGRVSGEELVAEETAYREMRAKLDSMGPVNMMALEEYKETAQRHEFLDTQRKDLLDSDREHAGDDQGNRRRYQAEV